MMTWLIKTFIKNNENISNPTVKKAYAALSSIVGIILNLLLCIAKIFIGFISNSISISADGFNNLSDAGTSLMSFLGFKIARYSGGEVHPFGHGRIEWIMSIFTSFAVILMGIKLADTSFASIQNPQKTVFNITVIVVLVLSILVKCYMYFYNNRLAKITGSSTLKATAADCLGDSLATSAVLASAIISHLTNWEVDGYCGVLVSVFIMIAGIKSLWEVLGRIMGKAAEQNTIDDIKKHIKLHTEIRDVHSLMVHDYGFGYFVVSMRVEGYRKDSEKLYNAINSISFCLSQKYKCDCFIQIDYLVENKDLIENISNQISFILQRYKGEITANNLRLIESDTGINIVFDVLYPAQMQQREEEIIKTIGCELEKTNNNYRTTIKGIIRRERFSLHR